jgi:hypothetical protein
MKELTREEVKLLAAYEMELYEKDREHPSEDILRYGKEADDILYRRDHRLPITRRV